MTGGQGAATAGAGRAAGGQEPVPRPSAGPGPMPRPSAAELGPIPRPAAAGQEPVPRPSAGPGPGPRAGTPARRPGPLRLFRFLIYGLVLASSGAQYAVVPILPVYAHRLGLTGLQQGMVLGATGLATLAVSVPAGALSDRFGARRLTLWAGWVMAAALFAQAMAGSFPVLLAARLGFGVGFAVVWTAGLSWLTEAAPGGPGLGGTVASAGPAAWSGRPWPGSPSSTSAW